MIRHLMVPITAAMLAMGTAGAYAQSAFPAPLPNQAPSSSAFPPVNGSAPVASVGAAPQSSFPVNGAAPIGGAGAFSAAPPTQAGPGEDCMKAFVPLREEAEKRGKLIKAASDRHAPPDEACKLIRNFSQAEVKMIKYIETILGRPEDYETSAEQEIEDFEAAFGKLDKKWERRWRAWMKNVR